MIGKGGGGFGLGGGKIGGSGGGLGGGQRGAGLSSGSEGGGPFGDAQNVSLPTQKIPGRELPGRSANLTEHVVPRSAPGGGGFLPLAGRGSEVAADQYKCPHEGCGYTWRRNKVGDKPPDCPTHKVQVVRR